MADCQFTITGPDTIYEGDNVTFRITPPVVHPCQTDIEIFDLEAGGGAEGIPAHQGDEIGPVRITQAAQGSVSVKVTKGNGSIKIKVTMECPGQCGPNSKELTVLVLSRPTKKWFWEIFKTFGLVVTVPLFLFYLLLYLISIGQLEEAKRLARRVYRHGFPDWLQRLLG